MRALFYLLNLPSAQSQRQTMFSDKKLVFFIASFFFCFFADETVIQGSEGNECRNVSDWNNTSHNKIWQRLWNCLKHNETSCSSKRQVEVNCTHLCILNETRPNPEDKSSFPAMCNSSNIGWCECKPGHLNLSPPFSANGRANNSQKTEICNATLSFVCKKMEEKKVNDYVAKFAPQNMITSKFCGLFGEQWSGNNSSAWEYFLGWLNENNSVKNISKEGLRNCINWMIEVVNLTCFDQPFRVKSSNSELEIIVWNLLKNESGAILSKSLQNLCGKQAICTVKRIIMRIKNVTIPTGHLQWNSPPLGFSEIISLDYIANGKMLRRLKNETLALSFPNKLKNVLKEQVKCLFFDGENWSDKDMTVGSVYDDNITCLTNHLTSFTMVILSKTKGVSTSDKKALSVVYYIGSGLSLAGLMFSCVVYVVLYKDLKILTTSRHLIHFNLQIALGLTQIVFLAGGVTPKNGVVCKGVAILLHYFSLASFVWILLEATMLYLKLISVYNGEFVRMKNFMIFGWGFPLVFVGCATAIRSDKVVTEQWCWISYKNGFFWVFFAPVIIILSVTLMVVIAVARVVFRLSNADGNDTMKKIISAARGVIILSPTLGLCWAFGVIARYSDVVVWQYLFAIFTGMQGFFIFLIYGVCNREIRVAVGRKIGYNVSSSSAKT